MNKIMKLFFISLFLVVTANAQRGGGTSSALILGNAAPLEGSTETYYIQSRGEPIPPGTIFQWIITNGVKISENINPAAGNLSVTVKWNFTVTTGRVALNELASANQIYKDVQIIPYYAAQPFCNEIVPAHQEMTWSLNGQTIYAPRFSCTINPSNPYTITYGWQSAWLSPDDDLLPNPVYNWQFVSGAANESIQPLAQYDYGSMYYRRIMYIADGTTGAILGTIISNAVRCRLSGLTGGQIFDTHDPLNPDAVLNLNYNTPTEVMETDANGGLCTDKTYIWEISAEGSPWLLFGNGKTYPFNGQNITRGNFRLRRKVICGPDEAFSNVLTYNINYQSPFAEQKNYGRVHIITKPDVKDFPQVDQLPTGDQFVATEYTDGLGRPIQSISKETANFNGVKGDVVAHIAYDAAGRTDKSYLPFATQQTPGFFKINAAAEQKSYNTAKYGEPATAPTWSQTIYEESPLGRPRNVKEPGAARGGNPAYKGNSMQYEVNRADENVHSWSIGLNPGDLPVNEGTYITGMLYKTVHKDDREKLTIEYTDFAGKLLLKKVQEKETGSGLTIQHKGWICTYYIYDDLGRQRFSLTPKAVDFLDDNGWNLAANTELIRELCFYTDYDDKGRVIVSHRPGTGNANSKGEVYTVYDRRDRVVLTQDENQRKRETTRGKQQWSFVLYDELDRNIVSGLVDLNMNRTTLQAAVDQLNNQIVSVNLFTGTNETVTVHNPIVGSGNICATCTNLVVNSISYYDEHNYPGTKTYDANYTFPVAQPGTYPLVSTVSLRTIGFSTGSKTRLLDDKYDDNIPLNDKFLTGSVYYDEKGRMFESLGDNIKGGVDAGITQYDYTGVVLSSVEKRNIPGTQYNNYIITSRSEYDYTGKVISIHKKYGNTPEKKLAAFEYDEMGILKDKTIAPGYTGNGGSYMEKLRYSYNILGTVTGINKDYALSPNYNSTQWDNFFGLYFGYDNIDGVFASNRYNGQLTGVQWRTQGDNISRKYDYTYDNLGRFTTAIFTQKEKPGDAWANNKYDFTVNNISYDLNGNILAMIQKGALPGKTGSNIIDNLNYSYLPNSNKLVKVTDNSSLGTDNGKLGDFTDGNNAANDDYTYDDNGNLLIDRNKNIYNGANTAIGVEYNFLDKPQKIYISNKSIVEYIYDAGGGKIAKKVTSVSGTAKTTWYLGGFVFEEKNGLNELQFISNEAGRLRLIQPRNMTTPPAYYDLEVSGGIPMPDAKIGVFDYFITDHLGSTRMVLTEEIHRERHSCSMEESNATRKAYEETNFGKVNSTGQPASNNELVLTRSSHPEWTSNSSLKSSRLGGPAASQKRIGPNMLMKVMAGDQLNLSVKYFYKGNVSNTPGSGLAIPIGLLINNLLLNGSGTNGSIKSFGADIGTQVGLPGGVLNSFLNNQNPAAANRPNAWLNWLFFDENFNFIVPDGQSGVRVEAPINPANPVVDKTIFVPNLKVPKNGYVLIYVSNENETLPVYFDDLDIIHNRGRITEENHYYAYGQKIHGIGGKSFGKLDNKYKYQGAYAEEEEETGWNEFDLRMYDPQIGRWLGADPYDEFANPYTGMGNDPVNIFDEDGGSTNPDWYRDEISGSILWSDRTDDELYVKGVRYKNIGAKYFERQTSFNHEKSTYNYEYFDLSSLGEHKAELGRSVTGVGSFKDGSFRKSHFYGHSSGFWDEGKFEIGFADADEIYDYENRHNMATIRPAIEREPTLMAKLQQSGFVGNMLYQTANAPYVFGTSMLRGPTHNFKNLNGEWVEGEDRINSMVGTGAMFMPVPKGIIAAESINIASSIGGKTLPMTVEKILPQGSKIADIINDVKGMTWATGNEHAVVRLANGQKAIVSGGSGGIQFQIGQIKTLFGHTHPTFAPPSLADYNALKILGQSKQYVIHGGETTLIRPN
jgi:RHS repeat-associated protein